MVKRRDNDHVMWGLERRMEMNRWRRIETPWTTSEPGLPFNSGKSMKENYLPIMRCPVYRRRDSNLGFRMELENLADDGKGKGASGGPTRPKVPKRQLGADCSAIALKWGNAHGAKGAGHPRRDRSESTGNRRNSLIPAEGGSLQGVARAG